MNATLRWVKLEAVMFSNLENKAISASKFNSFNKDQISALENS